MITIIIEGPEKSGKSHLIAIIGKYLKSLGLNVTIQAEVTHNAGTLSLADEELINHLTNEKIVVKEMRTSS
jgi:thymidylate kinase